MRFLDALWEFIGKIWTQPKEDEESPGELVDVATHAILFKIENEAPGVVLSYLVRSQEAPQDLLFTLMSLALLKEDFARGREMRRLSDPFFLIREREFDDQLEEYLEGYGYLNRWHISHLIVLVWRSRKQYQRDKRDGWAIYPILVIPGDLQGLHFAAGDRYAKQVTLDLAKIALTKTPGQYYKWRQIILAYPWVRAADAIARARIGKSHILQPRGPGHQELE